MVVVRCAGGKREPVSPSLFLRGFAARCGGFATRGPPVSGAVVFWWLVDGSAQPGVIWTVHAPDSVRPSTATRTPSPGTVKLSPRATGASASGG